MGGAQERGPQTGINFQADLGAASAIPPTPESPTAPEGKEKFLKGKVAIVTGGARGIGKGIALKLAEYGASAVAIGCTPGGIARAEQTADELTKLGTTALVLPGDISVPSVPGALVAKATDAFKKIGRINVLINNAGILDDAPITSMTTTQWDNVMNTNLRAAFLFSKELAMGMMRNKNGVIINIGSLVGLTGNFGSENYAAAKSALNGLTKSLVTDLGSRGIRIITIAPGFIDTDIMDPIPEDHRKAIIALTPAGRLGTPEDIGEFTAFLVSDRASFITAQTFIIDGGLGETFLALKRLHKAGLIELST